MKNRFAILAACFIFTAFAAFGQNQAILPLASEIYGEMDALYLMRGLGTPSAARPWTASEAQMILERINPLSLNGRERRLYDHIDEAISRPLRFSPDNAFSFDARLDLALEAYTHANSSDFTLSEDWNYGYEKRQPPIKLSLEMSLYSWLYVYTDLEINRNRFNYRDQNRSVADLDPDKGIGAETAFTYSYLFPWRSWAYSRHFLTNIPTETDEFDFDWPKRASIAVGGRNWNLSIARDRLQWGLGKSGNFVFDSHRNYDEYFRFSAYSDRFKYEWLNVFYPGPETGGESFKFMMAHRLEFRLLPFLTFAVSENVICRPANFNPGYINPAFVFHNWYDRDSFNSLAHLEMDIVPYWGYRLYTQAAFDQIKAPWEDDREPSIWGVLAGIEHARPAGPGFLGISLEWAYTTPLLYRRDMVDFITLRDTKVNGMSRNLSLDYTGYPYGGDAIVLQLDTSYRLPGTALLHARLFGMIHGKMNFFISHNSGGDNTEYADLNTHTPSGGKDEREYTFGFTLGGSYSIPRPVSWLRIRAWAELDVISKKNKLMISGDGTRTGEDIVYHKAGTSADFQFSVGIGLGL